MHCTLSRNCLFLFSCCRLLLVPILKTTHLSHSVIVFYSNQQSAPGRVVKVHGVRFVLVEPDFSFNVTYVQD